MNKIASARTPSIVYNPNDATGGMHQAFISFRLTSDPTTGPIRAFDLDTTDANGDKWNLDTSVSNVNSGNEPDITYRGNGNKIIVWGVGVFDTTTTYYIGQILVTDTIYRLYLDSNGFSTTFSMVSAKTPNISTSSGNQRDIYLSWEDRFDYDADQADIEKVVAIRELYP